MMEQSCGERLIKDGVRRMHVARDVVDLDKDFTHLRHGGRPVPIHSASD